MKTVLLVLQFVTILIIGLLGWLGLQTTYKNDDGRITRKGRGVFALIVISVFVGFAAQALQIFLEKNKEARDERQAMAMLQEIQRAVTKTRIVKLGFNLELLPNSEQFKRYLDRLSSSDQGKSNFGSYFYGPLLPDWKQEETARIALDQLNFSIWVFKSSEQIKWCSPDLVNEPLKPDYRFRTHVGTSPMFLNHDVSQNRWWIEVRNIDLQSQFVLNSSYDHGKNSKLQSVKDLEKACVVTFVNGREMAAGDESNTAVVTAKSIEVSYLALGLDDDQVITCENLQRVQNAEGYVFFFCTLPDEL